MNASAPRSDRHPAFVLLAAGRGQRFGPGKLTSDLAGRPVWRWAVESAVEAGFDNIRVVTNDGAIARDCTAHGWTAVANPDAEIGIASSLRVAAEAASPGGSVVMALADMPFVPAEHFRELACVPQVAFTHYADGKLGVPAAFTYADSRRLLTLQGDRGAAALSWPGAVTIVPPCAEALFDIDTPEALERAGAIAVRLSRAACR